MLQLLFWANIAQFIQRRSYTTKKLKAFLWIFVFCSCEWKILKLKRYFEDIFPSCLWNIYLTGFPFSIITSKNSEIIGILTIFLIHLDFRFLFFYIYIAIAKIIKFKRYFEDISPLCFGERRSLGRKYGAVSKSFDKWNTSTFFHPKSTSYFEVLTSWHPSEVIQKISFQR